jgi:hypothetical protein
MAEQTMNGSFSFLKDNTVHLLRINPTTELRITRMDQDFARLYLVTVEPTPYSQGSPEDIMQPVAEIQALTVTQPIVTQPQEVEAIIPDDFSVLHVLDQRPAMRFQNSFFLSWTSNYEVIYAGRRLIRFDTQRQFSIRK